MAADDDGFIVVTGRKASRRRQWKQTQPLNNEESVNIEQLTLKIESLIQELKDSQFYSDLSRKSAMFYQVVCMSKRLATSSSVHSFPMLMHHNVPRRPHFSAGTMLQCELLQKCKQTETLFDVVCYGLGRLSSCSSAQYQFAALTALTQDWKVRVVVPRLGTCECVCVLLVALFVTGCIALTVQLRI